MNIIIRKKMFIIEKWLRDFAYRINIIWWILISSGGLAFVIALMAVIYQVIKAATSNPIESLRSE